MTQVSQPLDRVEVIFDEDNLVANAGLILPATLADRLELEPLINDTVKLTGRVGGARPGRKMLTLVHAILAGGRTSITPMCCAPGRPGRCSVIG